MMLFKKRLRPFAFAAAILIAGFCLFLIQASFVVENTLLSPGFHAGLFEKHALYSQVEKMIGASIEKTLAGMDGSGDQEAAVNALRQLEASITAEMIDQNLDNLREGLFKYFSGSTRFLPDVILNAGADDVTGTDTLSLSVAGDSGIYAAAAFKSIEKINLDAILQYIDRNDVYDIFTSVRLLYFLVYRLPVFLLAAMMLTGMLVIFRSAGEKSGAQLLGLPLLASSLLGILTAGYASFYAAFQLPPHIYPLQDSLPLDSGVLLSYVQDSINRASLLLAALSIAAVLPGAALRAFPALKSHIVRAMPRIRKLSAYAVFPAVLALAVTAFGIYRDFPVEDFKKTTAILAGNVPVTHVISARGDNIYTLQVKLLEKPGDEPVKDVLINIDGQLSDSGNHLSLTATTDDAGMAKFSMDRGSYQLQIFPFSIPDELEPPSLFFFDIKSAGITIITVPVERKPAMEPADDGSPAVPAEDLTAGADG